MPNQTQAGKKGPASNNFNARHEILFFEGNIPIRKINSLSIYIPENNFRKIAELVNQTGLSAAKIIAASGRPCTCCKDKAVEVLVDDIVFRIPRGLLSEKKWNNGSNISSRHKDKNAKGKKKSKPNTK
jgi:hypothetical protein